MRPERSLHILLRSTRQRARISTEMLAPRMGLTLATLAARERGERKLFPTDVRRYLKFLQVLDSERAKRVQAQAAVLRLVGGVNGRELRNLRRQAKLTYREVAAKVGWSAEVLRDREHTGYVYPDEQSTAYLAAVTRMTTERARRLHRDVMQLLLRLPNRMVVPEFRVRRGNEWGELPHLPKPVELEQAAM